ncbi:hypothetical protein [Burkholderia anthina]|uniref:hypothetical protein n=1 Tax=Burkholderia anthina TaxID=179879 RepID=UPI001FC7C928|nr:hypothetical protein [Burkholderia anthina]
MPAPDVDPVQQPAVALDHDPRIRGAADDQGVGCGHRARPAARLREQLRELLREPLHVTRRVPCSTFIRQDAPCVEMKPFRDHL